MEICRIDRCCGQGDEHDEKIDLAKHGHVDEDIIARDVLNGRVRAVVEHEADDAVRGFCTLLQSPVERCSDGIAAFRIDVCARLDEEVTHCVLAIESGPLNLVSIGAAGRGL